MRSLTSRRHSRDDNRLSRYRRITDTRRRLSRTSSAGSRTAAWRVSNCFNRARCSHTPPYGPTSSPNHTTTTATDARIIRRRNKTCSPAVRQAGGVKSIETAAGSTARKASPCDTVDCSSPFSHWTPCGNKSFSRDSSAGTSASVHTTADKRPVAPRSSSIDKRMCWISCTRSSTHGSGSPDATTSRRRKTTGTPSSWITISTWESDRCRKTWRPAGWGLPDNRYTCHQASRFKSRRSGVSPAVRSGPANAFRSSSRAPAINTTDSPAPRCNTS